MSSYQAYGAHQAPPFSNNASSSKLQYPYPPNNSAYGASNAESLEDVVSPLKAKHADVVVDMREISRTPSPTPSEVAELKKTHVIDFKAMANWRWWLRKEWIWYYIIGVILTVVTILFTVYHKQIVHALQPTANKIHDLPAGWLIPIAIFFVISFPPLFGHEILAILCGLVWGLWPGFAITAAGTFIGEVGNFYAFRYCCAARGEKLERTQISYACLAKIVRDGGFWIALIARFSAIPGHFTTAVFSTCGMNIWVFSLAAILSLPKQFITVYIGVALEQSETGGSSTRDTIIKDVVIALTTIITFAALWYIYHKMNKVKPDVIYARRKARQAKMQRANLPFSNVSASESSSVFNPAGNTSDSHLPLTSKDDGFQYQQWDSEGRAVGYSGDPTLYAPQPKRPASRIPSLPPSSTATSRSNTLGPKSPPPMSERKNNLSPAKQTSWTAPSSENAYQMTGMSASPYRDPFAPSNTNTPRIASPPLNNPYIRNTQSPGASIPPPGLSSRPPLPSTAAAAVSPVPAVNTAPAHVPYFSSSSTQATPTQAQFPSYNPPSYQPQQPSHQPSSYQLPEIPLSASPIPLPPPGGGHGVQPTDATFYTAYGHSRPGTNASEDPYTAYDSSSSIR